MNSFNVKAEVNQLSAWA